MRAIAGLGRTDTMFASEQVGLKPDLMTAAKSIAGGLPLAAVVGRASMMDAIPPGSTGGTFAGNPIACAAALAAIALLEAEVKSGRPEAQGRRIHARMQAIATRRGACRRCAGLRPMQAIELVRDRTTRGPAAVETQLVIAEARARGVLLLSAGRRSSPWRAGKSW